MIFLTPEEPGNTEIKSLVQRYIKFIKKYVIVEMKFTGTGKMKSKTKDGTKKTVKLESEKMLRHLEKIDAYKILFDEKGEELSSVEFAKLIQKKFDEGTSKILFIIGGAFGVDNSLKNRVNKIISLSKMTLPHELAFLFSIEQVFRVLTIIKGEKYHH